MDRPDIKPEWSLVEKVLQILSVLILIALFVQLFAAWGALPQRIPSHFNAAGTPDSWGGKGSLLFCPIMALVLYALITVLERFPKLFNFPFEITEQNARYSYQTGREMLVCVKTEIVLVFGYLQWSSIEVAKGVQNSLGIWFLPIFLILLGGTMAYYIRRLVKHKNGE